MWARTVNMGRDTRRVTARLIPIVALVASCSIFHQSTTTGSLRDKVPSIAHAAVPKVRITWHPGMVQLGINVYWTANNKDAAEVIRAKARRIINYAISLNANSIVLSFPFYTYGITSDTLYANSSTPSPSRIAIFLTEAEKSKIRVTLRPILNENALVAQNPNAWRGSIEPANRTAWFESYQKLLMRYAAVAAEGHADTFVIGTELTSLEGDSHWPGVIRNIRSVFQSQLAYDENYVEYQQEDTNLPLSVFGVDAYPRFQLSDSATVSQLTKAWEQWLGIHTLAVRKQTILSEVGITAVSGAYSDPGRWLGVQQLPIVPALQSRWFNAVCRAVLKDKIGGVYWWEIDFDANPSQPAQFQSNKITFLGRAAQEQVKTCFAELSGSNE
jgi:hypothetical protein